MRYATKDELGPYIDYHRRMMIDRTVGLEDVRLEEDGEGAYALFLVRPRPNDTRKWSVEMTAGLARFKTLETDEEVQARVKVKPVDDSVDDSQWEA